MPNTAEWYETQMRAAAKIAVDINVGAATPGDLYAALLPVRNAARSDGLLRTEDSINEALAHLGAQETVGTFHDWALRADWFNHVINHAANES